MCYFMVKVGGFFYADLWRNSDNSLSLFVRLGKRMYWRKF